MDTRDNPYYGAELWTKSIPVNVYSLPGKTGFVYSIPKFSKIGAVENWVIREDNGEMWLKLKNAQPRYVLNTPALFDLKKLEASVEENTARDAEKYQDQINNRNNSLAEFFGFDFDFGEVLTPIILIIALLVILNLTRK